jgi:acetyl esterase/lipase
MPVGYVVTIALACCCTLAALTSRRAGGVLGPVQYFLGFVVNEQPVLACYWLGAATLLAAAQGDMRAPVAWLAAGAAAILVGGLVLLAVRSLPAGAVIDQALDDGLPASWHAAAGVRSAADLTPRFQAARLLAWPLLVRRLDVRRIAGIRYGDAGRANLLDVYRCRRRPAGQDLRPVLVHVHGGALVMGRKNREGLPLMYRLASRGWVCVSPNYRLRPAARWPDHVVDVKKVIAWLREHGPEHGADPDRIFLAGASSGAQLAAVAALTSADPRFQPGFAEADTSVCAAIARYGHYGWSDPGVGAPSSSPLAYVHADAPPFFVAHGDRDTLLPASAAREFAAALRDRSRSPVVYAELPGAQHQFDLFHSIRCIAVCNGIEAFAAWVLGCRRLS